MATADGPLPDQAPTTTTTGSSVQKRASAAPVTTPRFQPSLRPEPQLHHYSVRTSPGVRCAPRRCPAGNVLPGEQPSGLRRLPTFHTTGPAPRRACENGMPGRLVRIIREARQQTRRPGQIGRASAPGCATLGPQALQCAKGSPVGPCHDAPLPTFPTTGPAHRPACANGTPGSLVSIICEARQQMRRPGQIGATPKLRALREKKR